MIKNIITVGGIQIEKICKFHYRKVPILSWLKI